jgi:hypothetical protein
MNAQRLDVVKSQVLRNRVFVKQEEECGQKRAQLGGVEHPR